MIVSSTLLEVNKTICDLELEDDYNQESPIHSKIIISEDGQHVDIRSKTLYMPGLCIIDTGFSIHKPVTDTFIVKGDHLRITLFFDGNSRVWEKGAGDFYDLQTGIMRRHYQKELHWNIEMTPKREVSYVAIFMSKNYVKQLLVNEYWAQHDPFLNQVLTSGCYHPEEQRYFIDIPIKKVLNEILTEDHDQATRRHYLELKLKEMMLLLHAQKQVTDVETEIPQEVYDKVVSAKAYVLSNLSQPPTIKQLARIISLNELKLKQAFKLVHGITIHAFVIKKRMEHARKMLVENRSVNDMSSKLGYHSVSHFIETFKKYYGETPKQALSKLFSSKNLLCVLAMNEVVPYLMFSW